MLDISGKHNGRDGRGGIHDNGLSRTLSKSFLIAKVCTESASFRPQESYSMIWKALWHRWQEHISATYSQSFLASRQCLSGKYKVQEEKFSPNCRKLRHGGMLMKVSPERDQNSCFLTKFCSLTLARMFLKHIHSFNLMAYFGLRRRCSDILSFENR